jgi:hypothetical protein
MGREGSRRREVITSGTIAAALALFDVPTQMEEWYPDGAGEVTGVASYGRFRRFEVRTEEAVSPR